MLMPRLSILDQSIATAGQPHGQAIQNTIALAELCDDLGYARFWMSEHHNHPSILGTAPEILTAAIATRTRRIRVGSAGVMLPHYSAYKVAEQFRVLDAIAPGRIDLGLGRAPGSDGRTAFALNPLANERPAQFPADVRDLMAWTSGGELAEGHPFAGLKANPQGETAPEIWILGSSNYGAQVAAHFGLPYCFAWFFVDGRGAKEALEVYRANYQPSAQYREPHSGICIWALAAETTKEAQYHMTPRIKWRLMRDRGQFVEIEPPDVAAAQAYAPHEEAKIAAFRQDPLIGTGPDVANGIRELAADCGVQEVAVVTWTHDEEVRRRSYQILAAEFGLPAAS
jgi:luciferase family oxidoreductase group 1